MFILKKICSCLNRCYNFSLDPEPDKALNSEGWWYLPFAHGITSMKNMNWMVLWIPLMLTFDWNIANILATRNPSNSTTDGITDSQVNFPTAACWILHAWKINQVIIEGKFSQGSLPVVPFSEGWRIVWEILCCPLPVDKHASPQLACPSPHKRQV